MHSSSTVPTQKTSGTVSNPLYHTIWKWHFFAALYVLPFMLLLSITGGLYLFKSDIEKRIYADRIQVTAADTSLSYAEQSDSVKGLAEGIRIRSITAPTVAGQSTVIEYQDKSRTRSYAWVNPHTGEVIETQERDSTFMRQVQKLHGELLLGKTGTLFVELAAHWAVVLFISGIYLWWPRGQRTLAQAVALPKGTGRSWWKQTHLFTGLLATVLILPILITGLPWTDVWGGMLSQIQKKTGQESPSRAFGGAPILSSTSSGEPISVEQVIAIAEQAGAPTPYEIRPQRNPMQPIMCGVRFPKDRSELNCTSTNTTAKLLTALISVTSHHWPQA